MTPSLPTFFMASAMVLPDGVIGVGGNGANLRDHVTGNRLRHALHFFHGNRNSLFDARASSAHRVCTGGNGLHAFAEDRLSQNRGCGGAVARDVEVFDATSRTI